MNNIQKNYKPETQEMLNRGELKERLTDDSFGDCPIHYSEPVPVTRRCLNPVCVYNHALIVDHNKKIIRGVLCKYLK